MRRAAGRGAPEPAARELPAASVLDWHAHVYFDADTADFAQGLCERVSARFALPMGRVHRRPVGPHPRWSCQLTIAPDRFASAIAWLAINRNGLTVFVHPNSGEELADHRDRAIWLGSLEALNLAALAA